MEPSLQEPWDDNHSINEEQEQGRRGPREKNFWLGVPINFADSLPYSAAFRDDPIFREWFYFRLVGHSALREPIGQLKLGELIPHSAHEISEILQIDEIKIQSALDAFTKYRIMYDTGNSYWFRDAVIWTQSHKSKERMEKHREKVEASSQ